MASNAERLQACCAHAHQCRAWADLSEDETTKEEFLKVAAQWERLAQEIEEIERMHVFVDDAKRAQPPR